MCAASWLRFQTAVRQIKIGKRLPNAVYLHRAATSQLSFYLQKEISRAYLAARPNPAWNIAKLHADQFAISFLSYPDFDTDPHPALAEATKINLNTGSMVRTDYRGRANPPILHRKEAFLDKSDARAASFAALTKQEEEAGLYRDPSRIGLRVQWLTLLKHLGWRHFDHRLVRQVVREERANEHTSSCRPVVKRHRTAIKRYDLSKPIKMLLGRGLLRRHDSVFDYGCGHGMDIEALSNLGYHVQGWDPVFRPNAPRLRASIVNLGYILNVIEEPDERLAALREAYDLAERLLVVSTMVCGQESTAHKTRYRDGFLTKSHTFQKFYAPGELESLIDTMIPREPQNIGIASIPILVTKLLTLFPKWELLRHDPHGNRAGSPV